MTQTIKGPALTRASERKTAANAAKTPVSTNASGPWRKSWFKPRNRITTPASPAHTRKLKSYESDVGPYHRGMLEAVVNMLITDGKASHANSTAPSTPDVTNKHQLTASEWEARASRSSPFFVKYQS